jgi:hypothetical protein
MVRPDPLESVLGSGRGSTFVRSQFYHPRSFHARAIRTRRLSTNPQFADLGQRPWAGLQDHAFVFAQPAHDVATERVELEPVARVQRAVPLGRRSRASIEPEPDAGIRKMIHADM